MTRILLLPALLALLPPPAQDPASAPHKEIAALIEKLDAEDLAVRNEATERLASIGAPAVETLKKVREKAASEEQRSRADALVRRIQQGIRSKAFKGGAVEAGMAVRLECDRASYLPDEAIRFRCDFLNVADEPVDFNPPEDMMFDFDTPRMSHKAQGARMQILIRKPSDAPPSRISFSGFMEGGEDEAPSQPTKLRPGDHHFWLGAIAILQENDIGVILPPGDYEAIATYFAQTGSLLAGAATDLVSNRVRFSVKGG